MPGGTDFESARSELENEKKCEICNNGIRKSGIKCTNDGCNIILHLKCFEMVAKVFHTRKSDWRCKTCQVVNYNVNKSCGSSEEQIGNDVILLKKDIECLRQENNLLKKIVNELEYTNSLQKELLAKGKTVSTFSSITDKLEIPYSHIAAKTPLTHKKNTQKSAALIIKSNVENINVNTEIKKNFNPAHLNIRINNTKEIKGGLIVNCENTDSLKKLKNAVVNKFGKKFSVDEQKKFNPRLIIYGVDKSLSCDDLLVEDILLHNDNLKDLPDAKNIKIVTKINRKFSQNIVIEVSAAVRNVINSMGYLFVGWQKCTVADHLLVTRCYNCMRYGHLKKDCKKSTPTCPSCGDEHEEKDCRHSEEKKCVNCHDFNFRNKNTENVPVNHTANDYKLCSYYQYQLTLLKNKINYGE